jgi:hypothetical protein
LKEEEEEERGKEEKNKRIKEILTIKIKSFLARKWRA